MKKILAIILSLCLLCSTVALAENTTTITNSSEEQSATTTVSCTIEGGYTVTIPSAVTIDLVTRKGSGDVVIEANPILENGKTLKVYLEKLANANGAATYLKTINSQYEASLYYRVYNGDSTTAIFNKKLLLSAGGGADEQRTTLNFVIPETTAIKYAGTYTDTLTFSIVVE